MKCWSRAEAESGGAAAFLFTGGARCGRFFALTDEVFKLVHELVDVLERSIDRREADIRDLIYLVQLFHHRFADLFAGNLAVALLSQVGLDPAGDLIDGLHRNGPFLAGALETADYLGAVEWLAPVVLLDNHRSRFLDALIGSEATLARRAHPAAPNQSGVVGEPRVDDPIPTMAAEGTPHCLASAPAEWTSARR